MKTGIHPAYAEIEVKCSCGNTFKTESTLAPALGKSNGVLATDVCNACHPYYTGKQKILDTAGRVDKFNKRYGQKSA